ncbi:hypothetical protein [Deinococcus peraridilitoris]|uniref:Uncharacterized protein n=1 Tax=Deinococcus peraridilitoris (strain DSM 19664 / LMG 22246 / CIP 109416 / KR-200) TaxID=937777 RepID=L0A5Z4_DEIPD|nr:hypothetical protein [Deinococcus peraridilitoris]AFZ68440.1 hypothetical protein Deipe_2989 [Deinococcus peraridilitoris DSM 19664]
MYKVYVKAGDTFAPDAEHQSYREALEACAMPHGMTRYLVENENRIEVKNQNGETHYLILIEE